MNKRMKSRLAELQRVLRTRPISTAQARECFEHFKATGELPDDVALAYAVVQRVRKGYDDQYHANGDLDWGHAMQVMRTRPERKQDRVMERLLDEAALETGMMQAAARLKLVLLVATGIDVTGTSFVGKDLPEFGGVGTHLLGIPECYATRPYVGQARRLFARAQKLRLRLPQGDRRWIEDRDRAAEDFRLHGVRPDDDLTLEVVLVLGELAAVRRHAMGADVAPEMAAFARIARSKGSERETAIAELQEMARNGYFRDAVA